MKLFHYCASLLAACAGSAHAAELPNIQKIVSSIDGEYLSFTDAYGSRRVVDGQTQMDMGKTRVALTLSNGTRKFSDEKFSATRARASVSHEWTSRLSTRTSAGIATNAPVFVTRELQQEVSYKPLAETVVTAGARYAEYWGGVEARSYSLGASQYFRGGMIGYRFTSYDVEGLGRSSGHLLSAKLDDRLGSNRLWLGHGTSLHDVEWLASTAKGSFTSIEYSRTQPISRNVAVVAGIKRMRYEADHNKYQGTGVRLGLTFTK